MFDPSAWPQLSQTEPSENMSQNKSSFHKFFSLWYFCCIYTKGTFKRPNITANKWVSLLPPSPCFKCVLHWIILILCTEHTNSLVLVIISFLHLSSSLPQQHNLAACICLSICTVYEKSSDLNILIKIHAYYLISSDFSSNSAWKLNILYWLPGLFQVSFLLSQGFLLPSLCDAPSTPDT